MFEIQEFKGYEKTMERFKWLIIIWRIGGVPLFMKNKSTLYTLYQYAIFLLYTLLPLANIVDILTKMDDFRRLTVSLETAIPIVLVYWADITFRFQRKSFEKLILGTESFTWDDMPARDPETGNLTISGWIPRTQKIVKYALPLSYLCHMSQAILNITFNHALIISAWYPFDLYSSPAFELINSVQALQTLIAGCSVIGFIGCYIILIEIVCSQFDKLKAAFSEIKVDQETEEKQMLKKLNKCIHQHQHILEYMYNLENVMNFTIMGLFLLTMGSLCILYFITTMLWSYPLEMMRITIAVFIFTFYLFALCGFGDLLSEKAGQIAGSVYNLDWVGAPKSFQKSVRIILTVCNREFFLTAGKAVPVSRETMMNIIKETMSLFMFLLNVQEKHET